MATRIDVFSKLVDDFSRGDVLAVAPDTVLRDTVGRMATEKRSAAIVIDDESRVAGIVTEQDVVRRIALRAGADQATRDVMSSPVEMIRGGEYLYYAVARMRRLGYRHMPVVSDDGRLTGMLDLNDALGHAAGPLMGQIDDLTRDDSDDGLREIKAAQATLARQLLDEGLPATDVQALLTHVNNDIYRRIVRRCCRDMEADGLGPAPVSFAVIVMGSGGRDENYVHPDQDNGFILDDYADADHTAIDGWFIELAERMTTRLDHAGLPLCLGNVMATNPLWRKRRAEWVEQTKLWTQGRKPNALRHCDIFFDFRSVYGEDAYAAELRHHVTDLAAGNEALLRAMCGSGQGSGPALGWFGRFKTVSEPEAYRGHINLKYSGTLPLVTGMRLLALREGIAAPSTLNRMAALDEKGLLDRDDHDELAHAYRLMSEILLTSQLTAYEAGKAVTNFVHPGTLTRWQTQELKRALKAIVKFDERVRFEFTGEVY